MEIRRDFKLSFNKNMKFQNGKKKAKCVLIWNFMDLNLLEKNFLENQLCKHQPKKLVVV